MNFCCLILKTKPMRPLFSILFLLSLVLSVKAQTTNDVLNLLIQNNTITQEQADSIRAEAAINQQEADAKKKIFPVTAGRAFQLSGYGQFRYQHLQEEGKSDVFAVRRAYVNLKGDITPFWSYRLQVDFAFSPKIMDAYTELKIKDYINFTIGQQVIPFSLNNITSNTKLELDDRAQAVAAFSSRGGDVLGDNNGRDIGVSVYGSFLPVNNLNLIEYRIGVFNGMGINKLDLNEAKDIIGRIVFHPFKGMEIGGSFYSGWTPDSATINNKTAPELLGARQRLGAELNYTFKFMNIKAEYLVAKDGEVSKNGYYAQLAAFVIPSKVQIVGRYDTYDKDTDKEDNLNTNITFGANYFIHSFVLLQASYTIRQEEGNSIANDIASVQLQISF
jgi:phosphate-selective porin OprO and OprP